MKRKIIWVWVAFWMLWMLGGCSRIEFRTAEGMAWNTGYHITYEAEHDMSDSILTVLNAIDASLSPFNGESTVSKINDNRSDSTDDMVTEVYLESRRINKETEGAFDPTLAPLIRAWGFGQGHEVSADTIRLDSLLSFTGISKTELKEGRITKSDPRIEFNFSALAKGYGVDCIADMLERNGVVNFLVEVGGEIRASGHNRNGSAWTIGIDRPVEDSPTGDFQKIVSVTDAAIATSGNYRNFHKEGDLKFGHTISPTTGRPIATDVLSATVIAPTCMEADALATACMVMGSEKALLLCTRLKAGVMLVLTDMTVVTNDIFSSYTEGGSE